VDNDGNISAWSNFDSELDLLAPWDVIRSGDGEAAEKQGTSLSAAFVAGVAALVKEQDPEATVEDVLARIKEMTKLIDEKNNVYGDFTFMADNTEQDAEVSGEESGKVEDKEEDKIKGEDIDEVTSRYEAIRQSMQQFTGHNIVMDSYFTKETQK
jgi:subtilisin family serine protease